MTKIPWTNKDPNSFKLMTVLQIRKAEVTGNMLGEKQQAWQVDSKILELQSKFRFKTGGQLMMSLVLQCRTYNRKLTMELNCPSSGRLKKDPIQSLKRLNC